VERYVNRNPSATLIGAFASAILLVPFAARAQEPLKLDMALALASQQQPALEAFESAATAAREEAIAEGQLPDPKLRFGVQNYPVTGADSFRFERDEMTMATVGLMQEIVPSKKRRLASEQMTAEASRLDAERRATEVALRRDVTLAWLAVFAAGKRAELLKQTAAEFAAEQSVARARLSSQAPNTGELFQLETLLSMANDRRLVAVREEADARATLVRWIGEAAYRSLPEELPPSLESDPTEQTKLEQHVSLDAAWRAQDVARIDVERARAERRPNWEVELMYGARARDRSDMVTLQFTVDLPINREERQDRRTAARMAQLARARQLTEDRRRMLLAELTSAQVAWQSAVAREAEHMQRLLPAARARLAAVEAAYSTGNTPLATLWEARRGVLDADLEHWMILVEKARAIAQLNYFAGAAEGAR
jgi:outer membrane protein, heavy metal efflux system